MTAVMQLMQRAPGALRAPAAPRSDSLSPAASRSVLQLRPTARRQRSSVVVAAVDTEKPTTTDPNKPEIAKVADSVGLPTDEGLFGFKPFPEVWTGRLAMCGVVISLVEEFWTGKGTLQQIGISTPSTPVLLAILAISGGATLWATSQTLVKAQTGKLEPKQVERYKSFLGIQPDAEVDAEADALKRKGDFTSPDDPQAIEEARKAEKPVDGFLNMAAQEQEANEAAADLKEQEQRARDAASKGPSQSLAARSDVVEQTSAQQAEWAYARQVEVENGRAAMLGFWACIVVEAITGKGIIGQCILYLKATNILGPDSGF